MDILGITFRPFRRQDYIGYADADAGAYIAEGSGSVLIWEPSERTLTELAFGADADGAGPDERRWILSDLSPLPAADAGDWSEADADAAARQGWILASMADGTLVIERDDRSSRFGSDPEALGYVRARAEFFPGGVETRALAAAGVAGDVSPLAFAAFDPPSYPAVAGDPPGNTARRAARPSLALDEREAEAGGRLSFDPTSGLPVGMLDLSLAVGDFLAALPGYGSGQTGLGTFALRSPSGREYRVRIEDARVDSAAAIAAEEIASDLAWAGAGYVLEVGRGAAGTFAVTGRFDGPEPTTVRFRGERVALDETAAALLPARE